MLYEKSAFRKENKPDRFRQRRLKEQKQKEVHFRLQIHEPLWDIFVFLILFICFFDIAHSLPLLSPVISHAPKSFFAGLGDYFTKAGVSSRTN